MLAAQARVPFVRFLVWTAAGTLLWSVWLLGLGAGLGQGAEALFPRELGWIGALAAAVAVAAILVGRVLSRRRSARLDARATGVESPGTSASSPSP